jgi:hypothetical protein
VSVHVSSWVFKNSPAEKTDRLVLLVLADYANGDGTGAYPSVTTIQCDARVRGRSTVQGSLRTLETAHAIESTGADPEWGTTIYRVSMDLAEQDWADVYQPWEDPAAKHRRRRTPRASTRGGTETVPVARGTEKTPGGAQFSASGGTETGPKPSRDPSVNPPTPPNPLASEGESDRWERFLSGIRDQMTEAQFVGYFTAQDNRLELVRLERDDDALLVIVRSPHAGQAIASMFGPQMEVAAAHAYGPTAVVVVDEGAVDLDAKRREREDAEVKEARRLRRLARARDQLGGSA